MVHNYAPSLLSNIPALRDDATLAQQGMGVKGHELERLRMGARGPAVPCSMARSQRSRRAVSLMILIFAASSVKNPSASLDQSFIL